MTTNSFINGFNRGFRASFDSSPEPTVMMALGPMRFGVKTAEYESLKTSMSWRWVEKARYLREPGLQYHGPGVITKTFDILIIAEWAVDLQFLPLVRRMADLGKPQRMIAGHSSPIGAASAIAGGSDLGLWCITNLDVDESNFLRDGTAIMYKATLTVKSYGEDRV
ncbi:MAG: phage tail protein [Aeromonas sobria]